MLPFFGPRFGNPQHPSLGSGARVALDEAASGWRGPGASPTRRFTSGGTEADNLASLARGARCDTRGRDRLQPSRTRRSSRVEEIEARAARRDWSRERGWRRRNRQLKRGAG